MRSQKTRTRSCVGSTCTAQSPIVNLHTSLRPPLTELQSISTLIALSELLARTSSVYHAIHHRPRSWSISSSKSANLGLTVRTRLVHSSTQTQSLAEMAAIAPHLDVHSFTTLQNANSRHAPMLIVNTNTKKGKKPELVMCGKLVVSISATESLLRMKVSLKRSSFRMPRLAEEPDWIWSSQPHQLRMLYLVRFQMGCMVGEESMGSDSSRW
jgi:hypothetical protein